MFRTTTSEDVIEKKSFVILNYCFSLEKKN